MRFCSATLFVIALLILAGQPNAATITCQNLSASMLAIPMELVSFSLLALLFSFNVIAVGYIISKIIPGTSITGWISEEFVEMAKTGLLIASIFAVLVFMSNVASILTLPGNGYSTDYASNVAGLTRGACNYLETLTSSAGGIGSTYAYMLGFSQGVGALGSLEIGLEFPFPIPPVPDPMAWAFIVWSGFKEKPYANGFFESQAVTFPYESMMNDLFIFLLFPVSFVILAQEALLPTLVFLGLVVMIPFGLIFRAFPLVRSIGGTFVAIGIGVSIVYPSLLVVLNGPVTNALAFGNYATYAGSGISNCGSSVVATQACYITTFFSGSGSLPLSGAGTSGFFDGLIGSFQNAYPGANGFLYYGFFLILQFFLFILDLMIAYPIIDTIATSLGGTIQLSLGGKLKLV